jgi:methyl-accepting chemotaxis protein
LPTPLWNLDNDVVNSFVEALFLEPSLAYADVVWGGKVIAQHARAPWQHENLAYFEQSATFLVQTTDILYNDSRVGVMRLAISREGLDHGVGHPNSPGAQYPRARPRQDDYDDEHEEKAETFPCGAATRGQPGDQNPRERVKNELIINITGIIALTILIIAAIALTSMVITRRYVARPLADLQRSAALIAQGDLDASIETSEHDEIGRLAQDLTAMRNSIKSLLNTEPS